VAITKNCMKNKPLLLKKDKGVALLIAILSILFVTTIISGSFVVISLNASKRIRNTDYSVQSYYVAEGGIEDLIHRSRNGLQMPSPTSTLSVGAGTATRTYNDVGSIGTYTSQGDVSNRLRSLTLRVVQNTVEVEFFYGVQVGDLGFTSGNGTTIVGNVYSNGKIEGNSATNTTITGDATSAGTNTIKDIEIQGNAFGYDFDNCIVGGTASYANSFSGNCTAGSTQSVADPYPAVPFPITDEQIDDWKANAEAGGTMGDYYLDGIGTLGPIKVDGTFVLDNNSTLTLTGTVWVTGAVSLGNSVTVQLDPSYGSLSGLFIADQPVSTGNTTTLNGSGESGSYLMLVDTFLDSTAISLGNSAGAVIFYAPHGTIDVGNGLNLIEATGRGINVGNNATVTYESGLSNLNFSGGPGGGDTFLWEETF